MKKYSNSIAASMDEIIQSKEYKNIFASALTLEKVASKSSEDKEDDEEKTCNCEEECTCTKATEKEASAEDALIKKAYNSLIEASESLDEVGLEDLAAKSLELVSGLIVEAKAKKKKKKESKKSSDKKSDKKDSKKSETDKKSESKKSTDKKTDKKDSKKSSDDDKKMSKSAHDDEHHSLLEKLKELASKLGKHSLKELVEKALEEKKEENDPYKVPSDPLERERFYDEML